jgi:hypothetical protein
VTDLRKQRIALPLPPPAFRGRAAELSRLRRGLEKSRGVAVCGMGGIGKTSLALALADELEDDFERAAYVQARPGDTSAALVARLLPQVAHGALEQRRDTVAAAVALAEALTRVRTLCIVDDAHHFGSVELHGFLDRVLPHARDSRLVLLSRKDLTALHTDLLVLALEPLPRSEARALYRALSGTREVPRGVESGVPLQIRQIAAGAAQGSPVASLLERLSKDDRDLLERLAVCGPEIGPRDLSGDEGAIGRLRGHSLVEPEGGAVHLHDDVREAVREAARSRLDVRRREAVALLAGHVDPRCARDRLVLSVSLSDDDAALSSLRGLVRLSGFLSIGRAGVQGLEDRTLLDRVPMTRAALAAFELMAVAGGTPEWIAGLTVAPPGQSPEADALALLLGYGERASDVERRMESAARSEIPALGRLVAAMHLSQAGDVRAAEASERSRGEVDTSTPALAADVLSRLAWAMSFKDRGRACALLWEALPLARRSGDLAATMDIAVDLSLSMLALGELEATRAILAREMPVWRHALMEDPLALAVLLFGSVQAAAGRVPDDLPMLDPLVDGPTLSPLVRYHAAGRVSGILWLAGAYEEASRLLASATRLQVDRRATAGLSVIDSLIAQGQFAEAWERVVEVTAPRDSFTAVREAQLCYYGFDFKGTKKALARASRTFATSRATVDSLAARVLLGEGKSEEARALSRSLLEWGPRESARPAKLEAHALLAALDDDKGAHLGALKSYARGKGGLADRARAFVTVLSGEPADDEPWLADLAAGEIPEAGPMRPMAIDALGLRGKLPSVREAMIFGKRRSAVASVLAAAPLVFDCENRTLVVDGVSRDVTAQARPCRALEVLAEASPAWVPTNELFERVFDLPYRTTRVNALHAVVKRLRELLGPRARAVVSARGRYRFDASEACVLFKG